MAELLQALRDNASVVEAIGVLATVIVTTVLAIIAARALGAANRQAAASDAATIEIRREIEQARRLSFLANLPVLKVLRPVPSMSDDVPDFSTRVQLENASSVPAVDVKVDFHGEGPDGLPTQNSFANVRFAMLAPGDSGNAWVSTDRMLRPDWSAVRDSTEPGMRTPNYFAYQHVILVITCRSPLGSLVIEHYRWDTDSDGTNADRGWEVVKIEVAPDPLRLDDREVVRL